jgi:anti-sigma regulatory factor (Ser/Thr protein kinase)
MGDQAVTADAAMMRRGAAGNGGRRGTAQQAVAACEGESGQAGEIVRNGDCEWLMEVVWPGALSPYHRSPGTWRWRSRLELGALPTAPGSARGHVGNVLREWGLKEFIEATEMVVSELVSNSMLATREMHWPGRQPPVLLWLLSDGRRVLVLVWDGVPRPPQAREAGPDDESGRGLVIVDALSQEWASYPAGDCDGKVTWALITNP